MGRGFCFILVSAIDRILRELERILAGDGCPPERAVALIVTDGNPGVLKCSEVFPRSIEATLPETRLESILGNCAFRRTRTSFR